MANMRQIDDVYRAAGASPAARRPLASLAHGQPVSLRSAVTGSAPRDSSRWAPTGNKAADSSPAASSEADVIGGDLPAWPARSAVATITNVSVVACSRPLPRRGGMPTERRYSSAGSPRYQQQGERGTAAPPRSRWGSLRSSFS